VNFAEEGIASEWCIERTASLSRGHTEDSGGILERDNTARVTGQRRKKKVLRSALRRRESYEPQRTGRIRPAGINRHTTITEWELVQQTVRGGRSARKLRDKGGKEAREQGGARREKKGSGERSVFAFFIARGEQRLRKLETKRRAALNQRGKKKGWRQGIFELPPMIAAQGGDLCQRRQKKNRSAC